MKLFWKAFGPWLEKRREKREARRYGRMIVTLTLSPGALEHIRRRLAEDDWAEVRKRRGLEER